jgi:hypothetical protein
MKTLRALRKHSYGHAERRPGDSYEVPDSHAVLLAATGQAEVIEPHPFVRIMPHAESTQNEIAKQEEEIKPETPGRKRRYRRRDLQSEE